MRCVAHSRNTIITWWVSCQVGVVKNTGHHASVRRGESSRKIDFCVLLSGALWPTIMPGGVSLRLGHWSLLVRRVSFSFSLLSRKTFCFDITFFLHLGERAHLHCTYYFWGVVGRGPEASEWTRKSWCPTRTGAESKQCLLLKSRFPTAPWALTHNCVRSVLPTRRARPSVTPGCPGGVWLCRSHMCVEPPPSSPHLRPHSLQLRYFFILLCPWAGWPWLPSRRTERTAPPLETMCFAYLHKGMGCGRV